ncbi:MAG: hypothetical protein IID46_16075 [Planctomycetes bacterium]|nr:hypothetical protein [Planctomycetota bacterium]
MSVTLGNGGQLRIYGYGRGDLIFFTSRFNNAVIPFFVLSEDPASPTPVPEDDGQFNMNVRLTRLGFDYSGTQAQWFGCADLSAKIEIDFETLVNITSESRAVPRIRHAYGQMKWDAFSLLMGQTNDVISPLNPMINDDSLMWAAGNMGDRRPQIRATWERDLSGGRHFVIASSLSSGGAIDRQDLDGNGIKDGEDSGFPALQQRFAYRFPSKLSDNSAEIGAYWFLEWEDVQIPINGHDRFVSRGVGIDWSLPVSDRVTWRGEAWYGKNLSDWRGGIAQGVNTTTGEEIESRGGWTELQLEAAEWWRFAAGVTVDDPVNKDLIGNVTERTLNWTWYLGNRFNLGGGLNIHVNLEFWNTDYLTLQHGDAMRFKTVLIQRF